LVFPLAFFGFRVDKTGTRLADKNLDPITRMVPPTNLPELRMTLGDFVQSSRFIPYYAHVVRPLTELTHCDKGSLWLLSGLPRDNKVTITFATSYLMLFILPLPTIAYLSSIAAATRPTTARHMGSTNSATYRPAPNFPLPLTHPLKLIKYY
jgi:hypothetical protein